MSAEKVYTLNKSRYYQTRGKDYLTINERVIDEFLSSSFILLVIKVEADNSVHTFTKSMLQSPDIKGNKRFADTYGPNPEREVYLHQFIPNYRTPGEALRVESSDVRRTPVSNSLAGSTIGDEVRTHPEKGDYVLTYLPELGVTIVENSIGNMLAVEKKPFISDVPKGAAY